MQKQDYRTILYAIGSLPFWTGKKKLIRLLKGDPGSFWEGETPLKQVYLEQPFFGELAEYSKSDVRRAVQDLIRSDYLAHETMTGDKPYRVVKFSSKGVKKYYNSLVRHENLEEPYWWIHHLSRLRTKLNSPINTGGEILPYNEEFYLTQTPSFRTDQQRIQSSKTIKLTSSLPDMVQEGHIIARNVTIKIDSNPLLFIDDSSDVERINAGDLGRKLGHFQGRTSHRDPPDPFIVKGSLVEVSDPDREGFIRILLQNEDNKQLKILLKTSQVPDELELEPGEKYVLGPVTEGLDRDRQSNEDFDLSLEQTGKIRFHRP
jgi:hypothetical protein